MSERTDTPSLVETVRAACLEAALAAYEDAGIRGLCAEGRWEAALAAIRHVDPSRVFAPLLTLHTWMRLAVERARRSAAVFP
jgi:hypothetical protein